MSKDILASATLTIIANSFRNVSAGDHKSFRVKNLLAEEIVALVNLWDDRVSSGDLTGIKLVVASSLNGLIPARHVAEPGLSITWYRNNIQSGLVYLETEDQSDAQGLQNFFTLRDSNYLDGSFDDKAAPYSSVTKLLTASAWREIEKNLDPPSMLMTKVEQIIRLIHGHVEPVPVRKFVQFAKEACGAWRAHSGSKDEPTADMIIGNCLWRLDLFPDETWRERTSDGRTLRRLELNSRHADLRSTSGDLDPVALMDAARTAEFRDKDGRPCPASESQQWRDLCISYIKDQETSTLKKIPYRIFEQLFRKDTKGLLLGDRVRSEVQAADPARVAELDALDVVDGLNQKSQSDAERFLSSSPAQAGESMLADLLITKTRRMVERLAYPPAKTFQNPIIEIARQLEGIRSQAERREEIAGLHLELAVEEYKAGPTLPLFAFLYGKTLLEVCETTRDAEGACALTIDEKLVTVGMPPSLLEGEQDESEDENGPGELVWPELPLRLNILDASGQRLEMSDILLWKPASMSHLALFWLLVADLASPVFRNLGGSLATEEMKLAGTEWMEPFIARVADLAGMPDGPCTVLQGQNGFCDRMIEIRNDFRVNARTQGLSIEVINSYFDLWQQLMETARSEFIPDGTRIPALEAALSSDSISFGGGTRLVLPTQPLRLRWLGGLLLASKTLLTLLLGGEASFAVRDGEAYLSWLEDRSPHEIPPIALADDCEILFSRGEKSWYEEYSSLETGSTSLDGDPASTAAICARIGSYLDAHPYKRDGISLLFVLPSADTLAADILDELSRGSLKGEGRVTMTIAAPKYRWEGIARAVEGRQSAERNVRKGGMFPAHDLMFIEFERGGSLDTAIGDHKFDIGIVIHLLNGSMQAQQNTEPLLPVPGKYDPLLDPSTVMVSSEESGATSIIMKPGNPDVSLETWGTLVVRSNRASPVSRTQPENTDFVELRLNFGDSARVFNALHGCCHWVITLERHVSRKQIESFEAGAPDILSIMDGIGINGLNTLIVSSRSGRELIESRLVRKLRRLVPPGQLAAEKESYLAQLAKAIYDETRRFAPHLALNAMGISRVTEEILGLAIARAVSDQMIPLPAGRGRSTWVSLDEHSDWFGGVSTTRGDMCRLTFRLREDGMVVLDVVSLEAKLRQSFDPHGIAQADLTRQFMHDVMNTDKEDDSRSKIDSRLWRERILSAFEACGDEAIINIGLSGDDASKDLWQTIRHAFRDGKYVLESENAIYSICLWENMDEDIAVSLEGEVITVRSSNRHILPLVRRERAAEIAIRYAGLTVTKNKAAMREDTDPDPVIENPDIPKPSIVSSVLHVAEPEGMQLPQPATVPKKHMSPEALQAVYDEILACFSAHGISVSAAKIADEPVVEGPASILFKICPASGVDPRKLYEKADALKLHLKLEQEQSVGFDIDKGYVTVDVPKSAEQRYFVDAADLWSRWTRPKDALVAPLGEDRTGNVVELNFSSSNSPHLLIGGTTGSGKSEALNTILYGLISHYGPDELRLLLVDPKGTELSGFEHCPHLDGTIGWEDSDAITMLKRAVEEMQLRYQRFREIGVRSLSEHNGKVESAIRLPWWIIVLDEYADLTSDAQGKKDIEQELKRLAQKARAAGIHVVIATQKPSADVISTNLRSNLPAQLALRVKSGTESRVIMDSVGAESLNGKGDAYFKSEGKLRRVQCARVDVSRLRLQTDKRYLECGKI